MTDHPLPHPAEATEKLQRRVRNQPTRFARDLADQHFAEALDMLTENAREVLTETIFDDLRMSIAPAHFDHILNAYHARIDQWLAQTPTELKEDN